MKCPCILSMIPGLAIHSLRILSRRGKSGLRCSSCCLANSTVSRFSTVSPEVDKRKPARTVDEKAKSLLESKPSLVPNVFARFAAGLRIRFGKDPVSPELKTLLDASSTQIYFDCANKFDYEKLCELFGLPDYMSTWYKLTLMHCWMILMRLHSTLDADAYLRLQRGLLSAMWLDVDSRLAIVGEELKMVMNAQKDMKHMHGLHLQTLLEYDEGFLADDKRLAGAIWRNLHVEKDCEPIQVANAIAYIRSTMAWLDTLDQMDILAEGIKEWKQLQAVVKP